MLTHAPQERVVITGMGMVSALGHTAEASYRAAQRGVSGIARCDELLCGPMGADLEARVAAVVQDLDTTNLDLGKHSDKYSRGTLYGMVAAAEALQHADLPTGRMRDRVGVVCGAAGPSADVYFDASVAIAASRSTACISGAHAPHLSAHAPAALIAIRHGLRGPNMAASAACSTGNILAVLAADQIRAGRADIMVVGAVESCVGPLVMASFVRAGAVNPTSDPAGACRPFDLDRRGLVFGEGAGVLVLESRAHAEARGAKIHAELLGEGLTSDARHMWAPDVESWTRTIALAVKRSGLRPEEIDYISTHAAGTGLGDRCETDALKAALGAHAARVPASATKGLHGHAFAASSSMETILALRALQEGRVLPTTGLVNRDPKCDLDVSAEIGRTLDGNVLLKNSFGFGGSNCALVIRVCRP